MLKVFISGSASIKTLTPKIKQELKSLINNNSCILVGDCTGVDTLVQRYLKEINYNNVVVYFMGNSPRNILSDKFRLRSCRAQFGTYGRDHFAIKDIQMAEDCNYAMVFWDGRSNGSRNNIRKLKSINKLVCVKHII